MDYVQEKRKNDLNALSELFYYDGDPDSEITICVLREFIQEHPTALFQHAVISKMIAQGRIDIYTLIRIIELLDDNKELVKSLMYAIISDLEDISPQTLFGSVDVHALLIEYGYLDFDLDELTRDRKLEFIVGGYFTDLFADSTDDDYIINEVVYLYRKANEGKKR